MSDEANVLRARCDELEWELAHALNDLMDMGHEVKSAADSVNAARALVKGYKDQVEVLLAQRGSIQQCGAHCAREAA